MGQILSQHVDVEESQRAFN